jgi:hypothetical protein
VKEQIFEEIKKLDNITIGDLANMGIIDEDEVNSFKLLFLAHRYVPTKFTDEEVSESNDSKLVPVEINSPAKSTDVTAVAKRKRLTAKQKKEFVNLLKSGLNPRKVCEQMGLNSSTAYARTEKILGMKYEKWKAKNK